MKKVIWIVCLMSIGVAKYSAASCPIFEDTTYGTVLSRDKGLVDNAIVEHIGLKVPEHNTSAKKMLRRAHLVRYPNAIGTLLICHGFMCDKHDVGFLRCLFNPGKYNVMTFDFRAHGDDCAGQQCTFGLDEAYDVITAARFLKEYAPLQGKSLVVYGFSMGAVSALEAQAKDPSLFSGMVLDCPFDSSETVIKNSINNVRFSFFGYQFNVPARSLLQRYAFHPYVQSLIKAFLKTVSHLETKNIEFRMYPVNTGEEVQKIRVPCFFIHCKHDNKVTVESVKNLYERTSSNYKMLWITNGRNHYDSFFYNPEEYIKRACDFMNQAMRGELRNVHKKEITVDPDENEVHS